MPHVRDVLQALESIAPRRFAFAFDKVGLQVGDPDQKVTRAVVSLDRSLGVVQFAAECKAELLLAHHPLIFNPLETVDTRSHQGRTVVRLLQQGTSFIAAHTNWDSARGGVNDKLAKLLGLESVVEFGSSAGVKTIKFVTTCPEADAEKIVDAASDAGAGLIGAYSRCVFSVSGSGSFFGDETTRPAVGSPGQRTITPEVRIEMSIPEHKARSIERAVRRVHPYETPCIDFYPLSPVAEQPAGRLGALPTQMPLKELVALADSALATRSWAWGDPARIIKRVAVVGGSADGEWIDAQRAGADVLITGEVKQHVALEASESGMTMIASGHYQTEHPGAEELRNRMAEALPTIEWKLFTPPAGLHGRPFLIGIGLGQPDVLETW